jgi:hypothetical protein
LGNGWYLSPLSAGQQALEGAGGGIENDINKMEKANPSNHFYSNKELNPLTKELKKQMTKSEACTC